MTLSVFLIAYLVLVFIWLVFSLLILVNFLAWRGEVPYISAIVITYLVASFTVLGLTFYFASGIDWQRLIFS